MSEENGPPSKRLKIEKDELEKLSKEDLLERWYERETYIEALLSTKRAPSDSNDEIVGLRESEEKLKQQQIEASRRENVLVMRLTSKEQEMQEYINQITELKQAHSPQMAPLRNMLLDPAVNLLFQKMKKEMDQYKDKLEQAQNDLAAFKFTPDSQTGKRLMAKCRMVLSENEELGKMISAGRTAKLEGEIALGKKFVEEMKTSQAETDEFLVEMDEDVEGMQSTIYVLQQQLKEAKDQIAALQQDNELLRQQTDSKGGGERTVVSPGPGEVPGGTDSAQPGLGSSVGSTPDSTSSGTDNRTNSSHSYHNNSQTATATTTTTTTHRPATTNGDHHVAMETDTSEGHPESCDESGADRHQPHNTQAKQTNHAAHRTSQSSALSSEGAYTLEGTDVSSDAWSPAQGGKLGVTTDDHSGLVSDQYRTEGKAAERDSLQNGLVNSQYDSQGDEEDT